MEDTPVDQQIKIESNKSAGIPHGGPSSCTPTHISSGNNSGDKILIKYEIDESLDTKERIVQDQETKSESNKSTGRQDGGPSSFEPTHISRDKNPGAKTLIIYEIDESLDIKEEIVQDRQNKSESNKSTGGQDVGPSSCTPTVVSSDNSADSKTLIKYESGESLDIKEEIIQDQENKSESSKSIGGQDGGPSFCTPTHISSGNNSSAKTVIEYDIDESLDIKQEIIEVPESNQQMGHSLLSGKNQLDEKCVTTEVSCDNNSRAKTLIEYDYDETLEIKEEIRGGGNMNQELDEKGDLRWGTMDTREADIMKVKEQRSSEKEKIQESKSEPKKKYNCEKCARSYLQKKSFYSHKKFECDVMPQFSCEFCGKAFKRKSHVNEHILRVHRKLASKVSPIRHNCNKCSRSYSFLSDLSYHKREAHTVDKPQFICDYCGFETKRKKYLFKHITSRHLQKIYLCVREKKYNCEKCARSYFQKGSLYKHIKFECCVMPQFICEFCGKPFRQKVKLNDHIVRIHQKANTKASQMTHNCDKVSGSYSGLRGINYHKHREHAVVKPQFICDDCGFQTKRKHSLSQHFTSRHSKKMNVSITEPKKKYKCEKCVRRYVHHSSLFNHKKFECGVMPQFNCGLCGKWFKRKAHMNRHTLRMHQKAS